MNLIDIKNEVQKFQYMEDTSIIDVSLASIIANSLQLGDPVWLLIIGASSGGKSQILRPLSISNPNFMFRVDDLTENTLLSGIKTKGSEPVSLLHKMGKHSMMVISDFTVIMSKGSESRAAILSQFRMLYDGEMTKHSGNSADALTWKGYLGMLAGSTPSIYKHFEEVSDMGERFIYFRMKEYDARKATKLALSRTVFGSELDTKLSEIYGRYVKGIVHTIKPEDVVISDKMKERIIEVSMFAERVRTNASKDWQGNVNKIPVPAMPMRVALQLTAIAKGLASIRLHETGTCEFEESDYECIDWVGYSLANEENRACLKLLASVPFDVNMTTSMIADKIGLNTDITRSILQNMSAVGVLKRTGDENSLGWSYMDEDNYKIVRRIEQIKGIEIMQNRMMTEEEKGNNTVGSMEDFAEFTQ